jgi:UDP-N-acetylglucosamine 4,6-dehydratase/5-epimerase
MDPAALLEDRTILVTGGTGSFGKCFIRLLLERYEPRKVIVFSRDEFKQWEMRQSDPLFDHDRIRYFLGDVRDRDRLMRAFRGVDYIVHAAALKQVPAAEYNPTEFVKTNIIGAMNIIDAAVERGVDKVIALSTDKACNPVNLYGATKLCSDKLFVTGNAYVGQDGIPKFAVVRYGNVLGSRGSIIPRWRKLIADGGRELQVTDERMTRFWITLPQAALFVIDNFARMRGGEVFVPKIPSMRIVDLARAIGPEAEISITGIRPGEKLHEIMIGEDDARHSLEYNDYYVITPETDLGLRMANYERMRAAGAAAVPDGFHYSSENNDRWLDADALQEIISASGNGSGL